MNQPNTIKKKIVGKTIYGGMFVDKYYLELEGEENEFPMQVSYEDYEKYNKGDYYEVAKPK